MEHIDILLIDDNPEDRSLASHFLNRELDVDITHVIDDEDFEDALNRGGFDIVITDYRLRWADGLEILKRVKSRYPETGVIMFTGTGNEQIVVKGMRMGLDDYIIKSPGRFELIPPSVKSILDKKEQIRKRKQAEKREEFLHSLLRHDVRNKIQVILGYIELLEERNDPEDVSDYLKKVKRAAKEGLDIIQKVRKLRELEEEKIEPVEVIPILEEVVEEKRDHASEKGIEIELDLEERDCKVKGGPLLKELFENLLVNSIKHSDGDMIRITGSTEADVFICRVEDDGQGIPDEIEEEVFVKGVKREESSGSGLGMFLAAQLAQNYDGDVRLVDSEMGGAGFEVNLKTV